MDVVLMIIISILIVVCPRKGTFVNTFRLKFGCVELDMSTKEKSVPPHKSEHSSSKK